MVDADGCAEVGYTSDTAVVYTFYTAATDVDSMRLAHAGWGPYMPYATPYTYYLPNAEATYNMYAQLMDLYGNVGGHAGPLALELDVTVPATTTDFHILTASGTDKTLSKNVQLDVSTFSAFGYAASETPGDLTCGGTWLTPAHPVPFTLSDDDGMKIVYFTTRDEAGNMSPVQEDTVYLDTEGPDLTAFEVSDPAGFDCVGGGWTIDVHFAYDPSVTDARWLGIVTDATCTSWINISTYPNDTTISWTVPVPCQDGIRDYEFVGTLYDDVDPTHPYQSNAGVSMTDSLKFDFGGVGTAAAVEQYDHSTWDNIFSNEATVWTEFTGGSADIVEYRLAEASVDLANAVWHAYEDTVEFTWFDTSTVVQHAYMKAWAQFRDCAGTESGNVQAGTGIIFDFTNPVIDSMKINGGAPLTNNATVTVDLYWTEVYPSTVELSEDDTFDPMHATYQTYPSGTGSYSFTLSSGDDPKTVHARMYDRATNMSAPVSAVITLDETPPGGTLNIVSTNTLSMPGWTNTATVDLYVTWDSDVKQFRYRNYNPTGTWTYVNPAASPVTGHTITWAYGQQYVQIQFQDSASSWGSYVVDSIFADGTTPLAPATAVGIPGGSLQLEWAPVANAQSYILKYNYSNDYPEFTIPGDPPAPTGAPSDGFFEAEVTDTFYPFDGDFPDNYHFSIWTRNMAGTVSSAYNTDVLAPNYIQGDFTNTDNTELGPDGCIAFGPEIGALGASFRQADGDAYFNPYMDVFPTGDGTPTGYATPDDSVNFDDAIYVLLNYVNYRCAGLKFGGAPVYEPAPKVVAPTVMAVGCELPDYLARGSEYTVSVTTDDPSGLFGYHAVFQFDPDAVEVVSVEPGDIHQSVERYFFSYETGESSIDIADINATADGFAGEELVRITLRTKTHGAVELSPVELDFRDRANQNIDVNFNVAKTVGELPTSFALAQNYPNPFNPRTTIEFSLPIACDYKLTIYNITGQVVESFGGYSEAGYQSIEWDAERYSSGVYFYRLTAGTFTSTRKMALIK